MPSFLRRTPRSSGEPPASPERAAVASTGVRHMLVVGGTLHEWCREGPAAWHERAEALGNEACGLGVEWLTLRPYAARDAHAGGDIPTGAPDPGPDDPAGGVEPLEPPAGWQQEVEGDGRSCTVIVDPTADGRHRFAEAMRHLPPGEAVTEAWVASVLYTPAEAEPDLVLVLGPADRLPPSLVWELAYAELVFSDVAWGELSPADLRCAVDEFATRHRRFGGVEG